MAANTARSRDPCLLLTLNLSRVLALAERNLIDDPAHAAVVADLRARARAPWAGECRPQPVTSGASPRQK